VFAELIALADDLQRLVAASPQSEGSERIVAQSQQLTRRLAVAKHKLSLPENRLLGRFFEASRLDEVLGMVRDVNEAAVERVRTARADDTLKKIHDLNKSSEKLFFESVELQGKVEWLEVAFFAIYVAELIHIIGDSLQFDGMLVGFGALIGSLIAGGLAYYVLNPKKHAKLERFSPWMLFAAPGLLVVFLFVGFRNTKESRKVEVVDEHGKPVKIQIVENGAEAAPKAK
jgi:hypothetical protein